MSEIISIIMPAYNAEKTISQSIHSVLEQTFSDFKLYIINDASSDYTEDIVKSIKDERVIYIKNNTNLGVAASRNIAISICEGQFIAFLDSDDIWAKDKLELQYNILINGWDVVCSNYVTFYNELTNINGHRKSPEIIHYKDMLKSNYIGNLTGVYNSRKIGKIQQRNIGHEDYVMWLEIMKSASKAYCIQNSLAMYRISPSSLSGNKLRAIGWQWHIYRNVLGFGFLKGFYYFLCYVYNGISKRK